MASKIVVITAEKTENMAYSKVGPITVGLDDNWVKMH